MDAKFIKLVTNMRFVGANELLIPYFCDKTSAKSC